MFCHHAVSVVSASCVLSACANRTEAAETAGHSAALRYCTLCTSVSTAHRFCSEASDGKRECLTDNAGALNSRYCSVLGGRAAERSRAVACALQGQEEGGVQCELWSSGIRPPTAYSLAYCPEESAK